MSGSLAEPKNPFKMNDLSALGIKFRKEFF